MIRNVNMFNFITQYFKTIFLIVVMMVYPSAIFSGGDKDKHLSCVIVDLEESHDLECVKFIDLLGEHFLEVDYIGLNDLEEVINEDGMPKLKKNLAYYYDYIFFMLGQGVLPYETEKTPLDQPRFKKYGHAVMDLITHCASLPNKTIGCFLSHRYFKQAPQLETNFVMNTLGLCLGQNDQPTFRKHLDNYIAQPPHLRKDNPFKHVSCEPLEPNKCVYFPLKKKGLSLDVHRLAPTGFLFVNSYRANQFFISSRSFATLKGICPVNPTERSVLYDDIEHTINELVSFNELIKDSITKFLLGFLALIKPEDVIKTEGFNQHPVTELLALAQNDLVNKTTASSTHASSFISLADRYVSAAKKRQPDVTAWVDEPGIEYFTQRKDSKKDKIIATIKQLLLIHVIVSFNLDNLWVSFYPEMYMSRIGRRQDQCNSFLDGVRRFILMLDAVAKRLNVRPPVLISETNIVSGMYPSNKLIAKAIDNGAFNPHIIDNMTLFGTVHAGAEYDKFEFQDVSESRNLLVQNLFEETFWRHEFLAPLKEFNEFWKQFKSASGHSIELGGALINEQLFCREKDTGFQFSNTMGFGNHAMEKIDRSGLSVCDQNAEKAYNIGKLIFDQTVGPKGLFPGGTVRIYQPTLSSSTFNINMIAGAGTADKPVIVHSYSRNSSEFVSRLGVANIHMKHSFCVHFESEKGTAFESVKKQLNTLFNQMLTDASASHDLDAKLAQEFEKLVKPQLDVYLARLIQNIRSGNYSNLKDVYESQDSIWLSNLPTIVEQLCNSLKEETAEVSSSTVASASSSETGNTQSLEQKEQND